MNDDAMKIADGRRTYDNNAAALEARRPKTLEETIAEARASWEQRQTETERKLAETPEGQRYLEARQLVRDRLPPFVVDETAATLTARIRSPRLLEAAMAWAWTKPSQMFCGPTRVGKTTAAALLVRRLVGKSARAGGFDWELARRVRWIHAADLSNARRRHPLGEHEAPEVREAMHASLLVLDDLGWDLDAVVIREVLNHRYEHKVPTIVTTGLQPAAVLDRYGDAVVRRIFEAGGTGQIVSVFPEKAKES